MPIAKKTKSGKWSCVGRVDKSINASGYKHFTAGTKAEAERLANDAARGIVEKRQNMTVGEAIDQYIKDRENVLSPATVRGYKKIRKVYLQQLMPIRLCDLTQDKLQRAVNADSANHSPKTVRNAHGLLTAALRSTQSSISISAKLPQKEKPKISIPTKEQVAQLVKLSESDSDLHIAIMLASQQGLRRSEICALNGRDIADGLITIRGAYVLGADRHWTDKPPKTYSGYRTLQMTAEVKEALSRLVREPGERIVKINPDMVTKRFCRLLDNIPGFPRFRFHDLRHYYASVLLSLNVPDKYAMELMGHATDGMLKTVYQHTMADKRGEIVQAVSDYFNDVQQKTQQ